MVIIPTIAVAAKPSQPLITVNILGLTLSPFAYSKFNAIQVANIATIIEHITPIPNSLAISSVNFFFCFFVRLSFCFFLSSPYILPTQLYTSDAFPIPRFVFSWFSVPH